MIHQGLKRKGLFSCRFRVPIGKLIWNHLRLRIVSSQRQCVLSKAFADKVTGRGIVMVMIRVASGHFFSPVYEYLVFHYQLTIPF